MDNNNENQEVKEFVQKVAISPSDEEDDDIEDKEENETPEESSPQENEPDPEETETEEVEESKEQEAESLNIVPEPKPVEGETPRERALRMETSRLKGLLRQQRTEELFVQKTNKIPDDEELQQYDPEELKRFEQLATKMGFAKKDEILHQNSQERLNVEFESFIEAHQQYAPENDKDGLLWNQFKSEFSLYNTPNDPKVLRKVLNKVHNDVFGVQPAANLSKINASREKIKVASHTGASAGKTETRTRSLNTSGLRTDAFKGFSEQELKELLSE